MSTAASSDLTSHASCATQADVLVVGSGIAGTLTAATLGRAGYDVRLIDRHAVYPPDFRAEHLDGPQIEQLQRLGFLNDLTAGLYRGETVAVARSGQILGTAKSTNYGLRYEDLVSRARASLPPNVQTVTGRVKDVQTSDTIQRVGLADGRIITGRLIVLATGQGYTLCRQARITRRMIREGHSLTFGFNIEAVDSASFAQTFLIYQREIIKDRIDYLAAFTLGATTRVNLFTYRDYRDPWTKAFLNNPHAGLTEVLPGLQAVIGRYRTVGPVVARPTDLYRSEGFRRSGVVLVGDAFQSSCPATGMGMVKLLTDTEQLATRHIPRWLETAGMGVSKIAEYYDDPVKQICDSKALHDAEYRRSVSTATTLRWNAHRLRVHMMERLSVWRNRADKLSNPRISTAAAAPALLRT